MGAMGDVEKGMDTKTVPERKLRLYITFQVSCPCGWGAGADELQEALEDFERHECVHHEPKSYNDYMRDAILAKSALWEAFRSKATVKPTREGE